MKSKTIVALIPIKENSERIPNKNIKKIAGRPLCQWIVQTLLNVSEVKKIVINTDSQKIAKLCSINKKVIVHKRPQHLIGDFVSMNKIIEYELNCLKENFFLQTHATNPLLKTETISRAIHSFFGKESDYDSLFSVTKLYTRLYNQNHKPINHNPYDLIRTQDLEPVYEENSNLYLFSKKSFYKNNNRIGNNPKLFIINALESVDIDEKDDFLFSEYLLKKTKSANESK